MVPGGTTFQILNVETARPDFCSSKVKNWTKVLSVHYLSQTVPLITNTNGLGSRNRRIFLAVTANILEWGRKTLVMKLAT